MSISKSVWVHGPQGCGKTLNGQRLRRHFGLAHVVEADEVMFGSARIGTSTLVLANEPPPPQHAARVRVMTFAEAMRLGGFSRTPT